MEESAVKESKYRAVHVAARRARQLQSGSSPMVPNRSSKATRIAQDELQAGLISYIVPEGPSRKELGLPAGYTPSQNWPMMISLHDASEGRGQTAFRRGYNQTHEGHGRRYRRNCCL